MNPIITSVLDTDLYILNMGCVAFHLFPRARVTFKLINRGKTPFPPGFGRELQHQVNLMNRLALTESEQRWLNDIRYIRPTYIEWLAGYRFDPGEVFIAQEKDELTVQIGGLWYRAIYWEVPLLATISELYYQMTGQPMEADWLERIHAKATTLSNNGCHWIEFGARRRYSAMVEDAVVETMRSFNGFLGTSNPHFAHRWNVTPHGTYAHQAIQAMMALYGVRMANKMWMKHWAEIFEGDLGITLTDTFTTDVFLRDFGLYETKLFDGARHDSNDPYAWGEKMLRHYSDLGVLTSNKRFVFSDALKVGPPEQRMIGKAFNYVPLDIHYRKFCWPVGGIGTFLTNDVGVDPLNIVIKLMSADFGHGPVDVVKLSDDPGKYTGNPGAIAAARRELRLP